MSLHELSQETLNIFICSAGLVLLCRHYNTSAFSPAVEMNVVWRSATVIISAVAGMDYVGVLYRNETEA